MDMENSFSPVPKPRTRFNIGSELSSSDANFQAEAIQENISEITGSKLTPENMSVSSFLFASTPPVNDKTVLNGRDLCTGTTVLNEKNVIITPPPKPSREFSELSTDILLSTQYPSLYSSVRILMVTVMLFLCSFIIDNGFIATFLLLYKINIFQKSITKNHSLSAFPSRVIMSSSSNPSISTQSNESNSTAKLDLAFFPEGNNLEYKRISTQVCSSYAASRPRIKFIENPLYMSLSTFRSLSLSKIEDDNKASDFNSSYNDTKPSGNWADVLESTLSASGKSYFHSDNRYNSTSVWLVHDCQTSRRDFLRTIEVYPLCSGVLSVKDSNNATIELDNDSLMANNTSGTAVAFFGFVTIHTGKKERKRAHAKLRNMELSFYDDDETDDILYGPYSLFDCQLVCREDNKISIRLNEKERQNPVIFTVDDSAETWSLLLGEEYECMHIYQCWLSQFDLLRNNVPNNTACGTFWLRQGTNSKWMFTAAVFYERTMYYIVLNSPDYVYELDLRKVVCFAYIRFNPSLGTDFERKIGEIGLVPILQEKNQRGPFMLSLEGWYVCLVVAKYLRYRNSFRLNENSGTTFIFRSFKNKKSEKNLHAALSLPCKILEEYRLTADNVPVVSCFFFTICNFCKSPLLQIVDKCIRFMAAFGIQLEGIYRRNGKISEARDILTQLLNDPCGTHLLASTDETIYAVADVLRQFFRKLTNPLFPQNLHQQLFSLVKSQRTNADIILCEEYRQILQLMPVVHYYTLRKLMSHLKEVVSYSYINKASMDNLAKVFAPSLFHTDSEESGNYCFRDNSNEMSVIIDLLVGFDAIFQITTREEISRAMIEQAQLRKILNSKTVCSFIMNKSFEYVESKL
uniref:Rho-GAP domain-containing protein n=1 Tax=Heterorhabditis bacteriophora TaxID=37862 RepID=A0A1I7WUR8_HETBA